MAHMYCLQEKERKKSRTKKKMRKSTKLPKSNADKEIDTNKSKTNIFKK
jgi:hypothetical protein